MSEALMHRNSILIGLTLAVDEDFKILFVVLVFHRELPEIFIPYSAVHLHSR
jgi:hypothetical protein